MSYKEKVLRHTFEPTSYNTLLFGCRSNTYMKGVKLRSEVKESPYIIEASKNKFVMEVFQTES